MGVDWFTVIAQIINFLILVALLKRFLYRPIVQAMDRREAGIASRLAAAAEMTVDAEQQRVRYEGLLKEFSLHREEQLLETRAEVAELRQELLDKVRDEVDRARTQWQESFHREQESFLRSLRQYVCTEVFVVLQQVADEMADSTLQDRMVICLERRLLALEEAERDKLAVQLLLSREEIIVKSAFAMNSGSRKALVRVLVTLGVVAEQDERVKFEVDPSLICGIEVRSGGRSLAWNIEEYLDEMEQRLLESISTSTSGGKAG
ncbi:MAG: hypothetical protein WCA04_02620 [Geobacteraceae bacterium]